MTITTELAQRMRNLAKDIVNAVAEIDNLDDSRRLAHEEWARKKISAFVLDALEAAEKRGADMEVDCELYAESKLAQIKLHADLEKAQHRVAELEARTEQQPVEFDELRDSVAEMTGGRPMNWREGVSKGHHEVPFMNFNSLGRIVDKFRAPTAAQPVTVKLPQRQEPTSSGHYGEGYLIPCNCGSAIDYDETVEALAAAGIKIAEGE